MTPEELITRLEEVEAPDSTLDVEIGRCCQAQNEWPWRFTRSVDDALSLVPDGWHAEIDWREKVEGTGSCALQEFPLPCRRVPDKPFVFIGANTAIAICIAVLSARLMIDAVAIAAQRAEKLRRR